MDPITIEALINAPLSKVWAYWTEPAHIMKWNAASEDWHTPSATNDLRTGGSFTARMEAKDGSVGFDFGGIYTDVVPDQRIAYTMSDGRKVEVLFSEENGQTKIVETFDPENENPEDFQRGGWQSILNNFKKYVETN